MEGGEPAKPIHEGERCTMKDRGHIAKCPHCEVMRIIRKTGKKEKALVKGDSMEPWAEIGSAAAIVGLVLGDVLASCKDTEIALLTAQKIHSVAFHQVME